MEKWIVRLLNIFVAGFNPILLGAHRFRYIQFFYNPEID